MPPMNGVYVDPQDLRKSSDDVNDLAHFCQTGDGSDGDLAEPSKADTTAVADLKGFQLSTAIDDVNEEWRKKCDALGEDFAAYRDNLYYYCLALEGTDDLNAHGIDKADKPEWIDDVPSERENEDGVYEHA